MPPKKMSSCKTKSQRKNREHNLKEKWSDFFFNTKVRKTEHLSIEQDILN